MAARNGSNQQFTMVRDMWSLFGRCVGAAAADPTGLKGIGILSITRSSSGKYVITLNDKWNALLGYNFRVIDSTGLQHYSITVSAETVATTKTITIEVFAAATTVAPTRADLAATDILLIELNLSNSKQVPTGYS